MRISETTEIPFLREVTEWHNYKLNDVNENKCKSKAVAMYTYSRVEMYPYS
jgi:hypothetical protein